MARTKSKVQVAASVVPSKAEDATNADAITESIPSDSVDTEEITTVVHDKSEEGDKKEETRDDGQVETTATDGVPEGEKVEERDKMEEVEDEEQVENASIKKAQRMQKKEAAASAELNPLDSVAMEEVTTVVPDKSEEDDKKEETKDDGQVEPTATDGVPESEKVEEREKMKEVKNEEKRENASNKKAKRMMKKKKAVARAESNPSNSVAMQAGTTVVHEKSVEGDKKEETNDDGQVEPTAADGVPEGEKVEERDKMEEVEDEGKGENASNKKAKRMRRRKKKAAASEANKSNDADKPGASAAEKKDLKKADGMGLIFMCNAKTKQDCFRYKVLGLPANKKEIVAKVYKGMRLFLYDVDLKLMYGVYKAASPGGYNIEPKAFKSAFPSQVRFTILNDCLPLPEEKFKPAIKGNYYGRNKFNCQLSPDQVKSLCKVFESAGSTSKKRSHKAIREELVSTSADRDRRKRPRCERVRHDRLSPRGRDLYTRRESYASLPPRPLALPPPLPPPSYTYDRPLDDYYYRREPPPLELRDHRIMDIEMRPREPVEYRGPYTFYREPPRAPPYREALYPSASFPSAAYAPYPLYR